jgi:hypothetical protein
VRLKEGDDFWNGDYIYLPATDEVREISDFDNGTSTVTWLAAITTATAAADVYEIWSQFTPNEVHSAINYALREAWPYFFETDNDETLCLQGDGGLKITLPTTDTIKRLCGVYLKIYNGFASTVTTVGGAATQLTDASPPRAFAATDVGKYVAIYEDDSNNAGEIKIVTAYVSASELTTAAFSAAPAEGAKYRLLDFNDMYPTTMPLYNWVVNSQDTPTEIWLGSFPAGYEGYPLYFVYENEYPVLTTESGDTTCPVEYVYNAAMSYLYQIKMSSAPAVELPTWEAMHRAATQAAQLYADTHKFQHMPSMITKHNTGVGYPSDYPF